MSTQKPDPIASVAALDEPTRRRLYDYVVRSQRPVGRDEASEAVGIARPTAAFHLDRLAQDGLLDVVHRRLSGRTGPGAGRPAKLYLRAARQVEVSLPQRHYELAGELLATAIDASLADGEPIPEAVAREATSRGRAIGESAPDDDPVATLEAHHFEPRPENGLVRLGNCPFHNLAAEHTELVCGMNLNLVEGVLDGLGCTAYRAVLAPTPDNCCVVLESS